MTKKKSKRSDGLGRPPKYPWDRWLVNGFKKKLVKGKQYDCETHSLVMMFRRKARRLGLVVSVRQMEVESVKVSVVRKPKHLPKRRVKRARSTA